MTNSCSNSVMPDALQELTSETKNYAAAYLNETDESRENAVTEIRCWLEKNDDLSVRIDDFFILRFLRVCKFNLEKTKIRMRNYYKQLSNLPEWFRDKDPFQPKLQELLDLGLFLPLREPDSKGRLIIIIRSTRNDPRRHKVSDIVKIGVMATELATKNYTATSVYGCSIFIDIINPTMRHAMQMGPREIMNLVHAWQNCYPMRIQSINIINAPAYTEYIFKMFSSFMSEKMKSRFHVYTQRTMQNCFEDIPANILPVEYGGTGITFQELTEYWKKLIEKNRDWIMDNEKNKITISEQ